MLLQVSSIQQFTIVCTNFIQTYSTEFPGGSCLTMKSLLRMCSIISTSSRWMIAKQMNEFDQQVTVSASAHGYVMNCLHGYKSDWLNYINTVALLDSYFRRFIGQWRKPSDWLKSTESTYISVLLLKKKTFFLYFLSNDWNWITWNCKLSLKSAGLHKLTCPWWFLLCFGSLPVNCMNKNLPNPN